MRTASPRSDRMSLLTISEEPWLLHGSERDELTLRGAIDSVWLVGASSLAVKI